MSQLTPIQLMTATSAFNDLVKATEDKTHVSFLRAVESFVPVAHNQPILDKVSALVEGVENDTYPTLANNFSDALIYARDDSMRRRLEQDAIAEQEAALTSDNVVSIAEHTDDTVAQQHEILAEFQEQVSNMSMELDFNTSELLENAEREALRLTKAISDSIEYAMTAHTAVLQQRMDNVRAMTEAIEKLRSTTASLTGQQQYVPTNTAAMQLLRAIFASGNPMHLAATIRRVARKDKAVGKLALELIRELDKEEAYAKHLQSKARSTTIDINDL